MNWKITVISYVKLYSSSCAKKKVCLVVSMSMSTGRGFTGSRKKANMYNSNSHRSLSCYHPDSDPKNNKLNIYKSNNAEKNAWLILISCTILMLYLPVFPARVLDPPCHSYTQEGGPLVKSPSNEWTLNGCLSWSGVHKILILSVTVSHSDYPLMAPPQ